MLSLELVVESARRQDMPSRPLLDDAALQATYCLDAPDEVQDGMDWYVDENEPDIAGLAPRMVSLRKKNGGTE